MKIDAKAFGMELHIDTDGQPVWSYTVLIAGSLVVAALYIWKVC